MQLKLKEIETDELIIETPKKRNMVLPVDEVFYMSEGKSIFTTHFENH